MIIDILNQEWLSSFDNLVHWSELNQLKPESVSSHSYKVVCFTRIITEEIFDKEDHEVIKLACVDHAIFHDWDEIFIKRDLSHTTKYNKYNGDEIRKVLDDLVQHLIRENIGGKTPSRIMASNNVLKEALYKGVKEIVKTADWLALLHHCLIELRMGNATFEPHTIYCIERLKLSLYDVKTTTGIWNNNYLDLIDDFCNDLISNLTTEK